MRRWLAFVVVGVVLVVAACSSPSPPPSTPGVVRLDQVGYAPGESKIAYLLAPASASGAHADVVTASGKKVLTLAVGPTRGHWNRSFRDVRALDLTALRTPGTYRISVTGTVSADSPPFRIGAASTLFGGLAQDAIAYFQAHRDGADQVSSAWRREPAHLSDRQAFVYADPAFDDDGQFQGTLERDGGPVDVEGGWYDAGDFLKFTHTAAYALTTMLIAERDQPPIPGLPGEAAFGLSWLNKMWDGKTLYTQVGIGGGGDGFLGDHDTWRLPQDDDKLNVKPGDDKYFQRYRPVFRAAAPGEPISPNLAGRVAAAFALAAQVAPDPATAARYLSSAAAVYGSAKTDDPGELVTAEPRSFYPEDSWTDDMALGATELARAARKLGDARAATWQEQAVSWAADEADRGSEEALSVYEVGALADAELAGLPGVDVEGLRADMRRRLDAGRKAASANRLGAASGDGGSDYAARQLGYAATAELYEHAFHDTAYAPFATAQRNVVLGANGWGTSMIVGVGDRYPRCLHDQIASLTQGAQAMLGAVVNGPNTASRVKELLQESNREPCTDAKTYTEFDRRDAKFVDDTSISANTEPSIDYTATGFLAFALMSGQT